MADEIVIPVRLWTHRTNNAQATWSQMDATNDDHMVCGFLMPNAAAADLNGALSYPVPYNINGTPAATVIIHWVTASTDTSNSVRFVVNTFDITYNTTSTDPSSWDDSPAVTDISNGQYVENSIETAALSTTAVTAGKQIRFLIQRDPAHGSDTLSADVYITSVVLQADKT